MHKTIETIIYAIKIIILPAVLFVIWSRNFLIKIRYKRGKITKYKDFEIKRTVENKSRIYLIFGGKYHHVINEPTLKKLGFDLDEISKENDKCFSKSEYEKNGHRQGRDVQIYNLGEFRKNYFEVFKK